MRETYHYTYYGNDQFKTGDVLEMKRVTIAESFVLCRKGSSGFEHSTGSIEQWRVMEVDDKKRSKILLTLEKV